MEPLSKSELEALVEIFEIAENADHTNPEADAALDRFEVELDRHYREKGMQMPFREFRRLVIRRCRRFLSGEEELGE
jgi:RNase P subunit RPR2